MGNNQAPKWADLRPGYKQPEDKAGAGTIALAIIAAAIIIVAGIVGYIEYKEYRLTKELEATMKAWTQYQSPPAKKNNSRNGQTPERNKPKVTIDENGIPHVDMSEVEKATTDFITKTFSPHERRDRQRKERIQQEFANLCKFWTDQRPSEQRADKLETYCN